MTNFNSPYEFDQLTRNFFVMCLEKHLNFKTKSDEKISELSKLYLKNDLNKEKKLICLNYFKQICEQNGEEYKKFVDILQKVGFSAKNSKSFPKFLIDKDSQYIIDICDKKNFSQNLEKLETYALMNYTINYMDILLKFFSHYLNISSDGKNKNLYNTIFNKSISISSLCLEYNNEFHLKINENILLIVNSFNSDNIELCLDNYINSIITYIDNNSVKNIPVNHEYILDTSIKKKDDFQIYHKKYYQFNCKDELNFTNIFQYFSYCKQTIDTNTFKFVINKIKSKEKYYFHLYEICDESLINKYENLFKKYKKARKILKKSKKKQEFYYQVFTDIIYTNIEDNIFNYLLKINKNFDEFLIYGTSIKCNHLFKLNYFKEEIEYDVFNNIFNILSKIDSKIDKHNIQIYQFMVTMIFKFFYKIIDDKSLIQKIFEYDNKIQLFSVSSSLFALFKSLILKISIHKNLQDTELMNMYTTLQNNYYQHIKSFYTIKNITNKKKLLIKEISNDLPKELQKFLLSSELLLSLPYNKKSFTEMIEILVLVYNKQQNDKVNDKVKDTEIKKKDNIKINNKNLLELHLNDLLYSNIKSKQIQTKKIETETQDKNSFEYLQGKKTTRNCLQQLIDQLELFEEDSSEYILQLDELDLEIESLNAKHTFFEETCDEDIAEENSVDLGNKLVRYRALLKECQKKSNSNTSKIEELESKIDECISQMEYHRSMMPVLDPKTGKIQGSNTVTYLPYEEYEYKYNPLCEEGIKMKKIMDIQDRQIKKNDKILYQENKFTELLKQSQNIISNLVSQFNEFFEIKKPININIFSKKIVYDIFNQYWFNQKYCIKNKIEMYFRMYVKNGNKDFNKGFTQIVLNLMKILSAIQYVILNQNNLDFKKLIKTTRITLDKIHSLQIIYLGKTVQILDGDNINKIGIVFKETETNVIIKNNDDDTFLEESKTNIKQIEVNQDLIRKLVKPIIGHYKGFVCMIIGITKQDFILSLDTYGGRPDKILPRMIVFNAKREEFIILPESQQFTKDTNTFREFKESKLTFKPKSDDLYTYVRCLFDLFSLSTNYFLSYDTTISHDERFNFLYGIALVLYNKNKITDSKSFYLYEQLKNNLKSHEQDLHTCDKFSKNQLLKVIFKIKKELEKKTFEYNKLLILEEKEVWDNSLFETIPLNQNTDFLVFYNSSSEYIQTKSQKEKSIKKNNNKLQINVKNIIEKSICKIDAIFEEFENI